MVVAARRQASLWLAPAVRRTLPLHDNIWSPVSVFRVLNKAEAPASSILQAPGTRLSSVSWVVEEMGELLLQLPVAGHRQTRALDARDVQLLGLFALQRLDQGSATGSSPSSWLNRWNTALSAPLHRGSSLGCQELRRRPMRRPNGP